MASKDKAHKDIQSSRIQHDRVAKIGLKNKERFKAVLRFKLPPEQFDFFDFNRFTFIDTEVLQEKFKNIQVGSGDVFAQIGLKEIDDDIIVCIIVEHKSFIISGKELYIQAFKYHEALLKNGTYPILTIILAHCRHPINIPFDLQDAFGWTPKMKKVFGKKAFNFGLDVIDLIQEAEADIKARAGVASPLFLALKNIWDMTQDQIKSVVETCWHESKNIEDYHQYINFLVRYMLQGSRKPFKVFKEIEDEVIKDKEGHIMQSTYDQIMNEGLQDGIKEGRQKERKNVALNLLKAGIDHKIILDSTGLSEEDIEDLKNQNK